MTAAQLINSLLDVVVATELDQADDDIVSAGLALLSLAISRLPPEERELVLGAIEDGGLLRQAVGLFPGVLPHPKTANGNGHDAR
jgi:hypothetical protein